MAPEVLKGGALTAKIDVYAFGIVMWELFTGLGTFSLQPLLAPASSSPSASPPLSITEGTAR
jgi:serine/threonine protein kinase